MRATLTLLCMLLLPNLLPAQSRQQSGVNEVPPAQTTAPPGTSPDLRDPLAASTTAARASLGPGDLLEISVFDTPELTQHVRVASDGNIRLALIGEIQVSGMTPDGLRDKIARLLVDGRFVKDPQVSLFVSEYAGQVVYVLGEVNRPGAYPLLRSHRLLDFISVAGGLSARAGDSITISRMRDKAETLHIKLSTQEDEQDNPEILPGDRISVNAAGIVYVLGEVGRPGGFLIDRHHQVTVMQALALAEGIQSSASIKKASLFRGSDQARTQIPINVKKILQLQEPDIPVQSGDIIYIYGSPTRGLGRSAIQIVLATASAAAIYTAGR